MSLGRWIAGGASALLLAGCATAPKSSPAPPASPPPAAVTAAPAPSPPAPPPTSWEDMALAPGDWRFVAAPAAEAEYGVEGGSAFALKCDAPQRRLLMVRTGTAAGSVLTLRTSFGARQVAVGEDGTASLAAADSLLDDLVSSRGRVAVEADGLPALILPTWPEPARVVEECRG
jgi:hypothetical protein